MDEFHFLYLFSEAFNVCFNISTGGHGVKEYLCLNNKNVLGAREEALSHHNSIDMSINLRSECVGWGGFMVHVDHVQAPHLHGLVLHEVNGDC